MYDKQLSRMEAKLDALLDKAGIKASEFEATATTTAQPRKLTPAEQQAIDNAPKTPIGATPPAVTGARTDANNAPVTPTPPVPPDAVGSVTVETREPDGDVSVQTMDADNAKRGLPRRA